jgi:hypothetical protein
MANITSIKIPELSELSQEEFTGAEYLVLDTGTATKKMQVSDFNRASTETATAKANEATQSAQSAAQSALSAQNAAQAATDAIANATSQIAQSVIDVQTAKSDAESSANTARNLVNSDYALTSRSYATGDAVDALGHEYREGQSTDNAKYYAEQCEAHDSAAATSETNAKASENNAKASEIAAANSAESAARSAQQALENATGTSVFNGSDAGLVPSTDLSNGFLDADGQWKEKSWMNKHSFVNRVIDGNTTPRALSKGDLFMRPNKSDGEWRLCRATTAIAANTELSLGNYDDISFQTLLDEMKTSFRDGVDTIYNAVVARGGTPSASTPSAIATAINNLPNVNTDTYTFAANDTGSTKDMGEANANRYVNAKNVYTKGKADAEAVTWTETVNMYATGSTGNKSFYASSYFPVKNLKSFKIKTVTHGNNLRYYFKDGSYATPTIGTSYTIPNDATRLEIMAYGDSVSSLSGAVMNIDMDIELTYQAKILR